MHILLNPTSTEANGVIYLRDVAERDGLSVLGNKRKESRVNVS